jgi:hypothetical protein
MKPANTKSMGDLSQIPMLTIEDIDKHECFKDWPQEKKENLIKFVFELSLVLYHSYHKSHEE